MIPLATKPRPPGEHPATGPLAQFGATDGWTIDHVRKILANGIETQAGKFNIEIIVRDGQSDPNRAAEVAGADWRLVYGGRQRASMAFLDELACYGDRVSVRPQDETGLLDLETLLGTPQPDMLVYCCGPEPLLAAVERQVTAWPPRSLHVERFAPRPQTEPARTEAFEVVLRQSELTLSVPPDRSILSVVEEAGVGVLSSCAEGTCGTCETAVLDGVPDHRDSVLDESERKANDCMMICVSRARSDRLVLDL